MSTGRARAGKPLRIMVIGAHQDDCDIRAGGSAATWAAAGHQVLLVSATNGQSGHHRDGPGQLVQRRIAEARASAAVIGAQSQVWPIPDGHMEPSLANRLLFIRAIRRFAPDLILTHRPNDYHPDHRYTSQLVQDSSYMIRVPHVAPELPALDHNPVVAYLCDDFHKPCAFAADVVIGIDGVMDTKLAMIGCHASQVYEWLPWINGELERVPRGQVGRRRFLRDQWAPRSAEVADRFRAKLVKRYGARKGRAVRYAEAFEVCEYGGKPTADVVRGLFNV
jgi:LmbE family N-acetylglucosaminyl deacetylase